jgi:hypothetical protein
MSTAKYPHGANDIARVKRADHFSEISELDCIDPNFSIRPLFPDTIRWDHETLWQHKYSEDIFALNELYHFGTEAAALLDAAGIPWCRVSKKHAPYGNGTTSILLCFAHARDTLKEIERRLNDTTLSRQDIDRMLADGTLTRCD